jgi:hypothetical protein
MPNELPIPDAAKSSLAAIELARVWVASGAQHVSIATEIWEDPGAWGIVLVDLARHVANSYSATHGRDPRQTLSRIKEVFDAEWSKPTSEAKGGLV